MNKLKKRKTLIRKLFKEVAKETVGPENLKKLKFKIELQGRGASYCGVRWDWRGKKYILIGLDLEGLLYQVKNGYSSIYYKTRPELLNKYIINNRHNALRFILWHEARHAWQRIYDKNRDNEEIRERDADSWALAHIKTRPQDQTRPVKTFIPKATEYIRLYNLGYSTTKIAQVCKIKDPRSIRYYLTKAGINLRRS